MKFFLIFYLFIAFSSGAPNFTTFLKSGLSALGLGGSSTTTLTMQNNLFNGGSNIQYNDMSKKFDPQPPNYIFVQPNHHSFSGFERNNKNDYNNWNRNFQNEKK
ncbi:hypothetical protein PVAND_015981 [Polypedilum vanderplanki]|uniref:Uncharacterized protein n=1 Tax=Polypedilum vanderplanki TaxID=319348 RepID=A0A9J6BEJ4_POLVA|nr:hypothetical protein PVAND_015981 [Polypedilum vanderplanki]